MVERSAHAMSNLCLAMGVVFLQEDTSFVLHETSVLSRHGRHET